MKPLGSICIGLQMLPSMLLGVIHSVIQFEAFSKNIVSLKYTPSQSTLFSQYLILALLKFLKVICWKCIQKYLIDPWPFLSQLKSLKAICWKCIQNILVPHPPRVPIYLRLATWTPTTLTQDFYTLYLRLLYPSHTAAPKTSPQEVRHFLISIML